MDELNKNIQSQTKEPTRSRFPSPNRIVSIDIKPNEKSPKKKR
jgi:hypothetical protein